MVEVATLRPHGIKRKLVMSPLMAVETAGDMIGYYFPHGCKLLDILFVPTVAVGTAPSIIDVGVAQNGDTIIDGFSLTHTDSAAGTAVSIFQTKGTNGGLIDLPVGTTVWFQTDGSSTGGDGYFVIEYEDQNS